MKNQSKNPIQALGLEEFVVNLFNEKLKEVYQSIADTLLIEYDIEVTPEDVSLFLNSSQVQHFTDDQLLNLMINDVRMTLFGPEANLMDREERFSYMKLLESLLNTKHKLIGIEREQTNTDKDAEKLKEALANAGIQFTSKK